jgi:hypothetical protein
MRTVTEDHKSRTSLNLPDGLVKQARRVAIEQDRSLSAMVEDLLREYLDKVSRNAAANNVKRTRYASRARGIAARVAALERTAPGEPFLLITADNHR